MAISFGPKLNLLYNALISESYFDSLRLFLQSIDQLVNGSVINATQVTPPSSPNPGDAYLLIGGTPGGSWTGQAGNIAVWDSQLTTSGTNTVVPGWIFLTPKAGWTVWNIALAGLYVYNGTSWSAVGGTGANFPTNTDITSMTGIPNTTISSSGYAFNDGTDPATAINASGYLYGVAVTGTTGVGVQVANQSWPASSPPYTGPGIAVGSGANVSLVGAGIVQASNYVGTSNLDTVNIQATGYCYVGNIRVGSTGTGVITSFSTGQPVQIGALGNPTGVTMLINAGQVTPTKGQGYLGFNGNYWTQTTVGAAGAASAPPTTPALWVPVNVNGTNYLMALYTYA